MVVTLATDLKTDWLSRVTDLLSADTMVVPVTGEAASELAQRLPVSVIVAGLEPLTNEKMLGYLQMRKCCAEAVFVCVASAEVREQVRHEGLFSPDFWLDPQATLSEAQELLQHAVHKAHLLVDASPAPPAPEPQWRESAVEPFGPEQTVLHQLLGAMAGNTDPDRLLNAYIDAVAQLVRCAGYCFLWKSEDGSCLRVKRAQGLPPELATHGRLSRTDALPSWYRTNSRALTRQELAHWPSAPLAGALTRELQVFRGQVAIPLIIGGRLEGLLILAEKVVGELYSNSELETLFVLTSYVSVHLENLGLQAQVRETQEYMQRSLSAMRCGLITLGSDGCITVCNPYAAHVLKVRPQELEGADLRALPSPLGDYLYSAFKSPEAVVTAEHLSLAGLGVQLRVTTSPLLDGSGKAIGSVLLLEDISSTVEEAAETARQDTINALTRIIGRLAHDVRTPLTAIKTYAQLMDQPDDFEDLTQFWHDTVSPQLERLDRLISEQVKLIEPPPPSFQLVDVEKLVQEVVAKACLGDPDNGDPLLKIIGPLPRIVADPGPVRDAFGYLLRYLGAHGTSPVGVVLDEHRKGPIANVRIRMRSATNGSVPDPHTILDPVAVLQSEEGDLGPAISRQLIARQGGRVEAAHGDGYFEFRMLFPVNVVEPTDASAHEARG